MARMLPFPEIPRLYLISWCLFFVRLLEVGWKCILLFQVSVVELNFSPLKQMKMRTDLAWKWYSGSRSIPSDACLAISWENGVLRKPRQTGSKSEFLLRKMVSVKRQAGRQGVQLWRTRLDLSEGNLWAPGIDSLGPVVQRWTVESMCVKGSHHSRQLHRII